MVFFLFIGVTHISYFFINKKYNHLNDSLLHHALTLKEKIFMRMAPKRMIYNIRVEMSYGMAQRAVPTYRLQVVMRASCLVRHKEFDLGYDYKFSMKI